MAYTVSTAGYALNRVLVVGCGGTGGFVSEGLCRLLPRDWTLLLIDPDRVEPHNMLRQNFFHGDVGKFKAQVLAERLARNYGRRIAYSVFPYSEDSLKTGVGILGPGSYSLRSAIIIGCVDNALARRSIAKSIGDSAVQYWWLDSGNGEQSGQVLLGNCRDRGLLYQSFEEVDHTVTRLPIPSMQLPALLAPPTDQPKRRQRDCAQAIQEDGQSPVINQAMATLVLQFMDRFLRKKLTWMAAYLDLEAGTLHAVPAEPVTVAKMLSMKESMLMAPACHVGRMSGYRPNEEDEEEEE